MKKFLEITILAGVIYSSMVIYNIEKKLNQRSVSIDQINKNVDKIMTHCLQ